MPSGALASVNYGFEGTAFQTSGTINKGFGFGPKITGLERNNNVEVIWGLGDRESGVSIDKQFGGTFSVECMLTDPWIWYSIFGDKNVKGNTAAATTTLSGAHTLGSLTLNVVSALGIAANDIITVAGGHANTMEICKVSSVNSNVITIDKPLFFSHSDGATVNELGGTSPTSYYHLYRNSNTTQLNTLTIQNSIELGATDLQTNFLGCVPTGASLTVAVNEPVSIKFDFAFGKETPVGSSAFQSQIAPSYNVYSFSHGNLYFPGSSSSAVANIQNCEVTISPNIDLVYGLGNRNATTFVSKNMEYNIRASVYFANKTDFMSFFMDGTGTYPSGGPASSVAQNGLVLHLNDGTNKQVLLFGGVKIDTESISQDVTAPIIEEVNIKARMCNIYAQNANDGSTIYS